MAASFILSDVRLPAREGRDGALDLAGVALRIERANLNPERRRYGLDCAKLAGPGG